MQFSRSDLADLTYFQAIARHRSFRRAGLQLGISGSALSHAMKALEERLGVRLLHRTTRSVTLTTAGEEHFSSITDPMSALGDALESLNRFRDQPVGLVRINVPLDAASYLLRPVLKTFAERYPELQVEVCSSNRMVDVIDGGYDAGIRFGGTVPEDMIAQRLSADTRWVVVGSPDYLEKHGVPKQLSDLANHHCLRIRAGTGQIYNWELSGAGLDIQIDVPGPFVIDETRFAVSLAEDGVGLAYVMQPAVQKCLDRGSLSLVLEEHASMGPGYYMYYSSKRQLPVGLRRLIELIRGMRPLDF